MTTETEAKPGCEACDFVGRKGQCAHLRCYCGHKECWAFASWTPVTTPTVAPTTEATPHRRGGRR